MCILSVYTFLKVLGHYDLSVLSMSVRGFQKKVWMGVGGWVGGWGELYPIFFGIFLTLQSPLANTPTAVFTCTAHSCKFRCRLVFRFSQISTLRDLLVMHQFLATLAKLVIYSPWNHGIFTHLLVM